MLMPSIFGENLFDGWMDRAFKNAFPADRFGFGDFERGMKTDIKDTEDGYELSMELPGFSKEDISAQLKDGYLTISAAKNEAKDEKDKEGNYIRKERYSGQCSRSFYVGKELKQEDIKAKFDNGELVLRFPKAEERKEVPAEEYISIEG